MIERMDRDILILGSGGAGPVRRAARLPRRPRARHRRRRQGPARQERLHPHGAGRLQCGARARRQPRTPFHGHDRGRSLDQPPGARLDADRRRGRAHPRAGGRDRLLFRPQPGRQHSPEGVRRADLRPDRPQGRPDGHRDRQPADGAGLGAGGDAAGGAPGGGADPVPRRLAPRGRPPDRHSHRRAALRARQGRAARNRRRPHHVPLPHPLGRQDLRRHGDGVGRRASRCATWRWCSSTRPASMPAPARA